MYLNNSLYLLIEVGLDTKQMTREQGVWGQGSGGNRGTNVDLYHAHVYFDSGTRREAESLRRLLLKQKWPLVYVGRLREGAHGPHPEGAFEFHFRAALLEEIRDFFARFRGSLRVLIHVLTGDDHHDHGAGALWLGPELALDFSKLDPSPGNPLVEKTRLLDAPQGLLAQRGQQ